MITAAFIFIFFKLPKKLFEFIKILFEKLQLVLKFIFIKIPKMIIDGFKKFIDFMKYLFIPKNSKIKNTTHKKKPVSRKK